MALRARIQPPRRLTFDEEDVSSQVLLPAIRKICDNAVHILSCGHQEVHSFELLRCTLAIDGLDDWAGSASGEGKECGNSRVTFSSRISYCIRVLPSNFWACSSTTRIFHLPGGFTERIASRNPFVGALGEYRGFIYDALYVRLRTVVIREAIT